MSEDAAQISFFGAAVMARGLRNSQTRAYLILLAVVMLLTVLAYHKFNRRWIVYRSAEDSFSRKDFIQAIPLYVKALKEGAHTPEAWHHLGESYLAVADDKHALEIYEQLTRLYPEDLHSQKTLAEIYDRLDCVDDAIAAYLQHDGKTPLDTLSLLRLGDLYKRKGALDAARAVYGRLLAREPRSLPARMGLAELLSWMERYDEAIFFYRDILEEYPGNRLARIQLARVLGWSGRLDEAIEEYRNVLKGPSDHE